MLLVTLPGGRCLVPIATEISSQHKKFQTTTLLDLCNDGTCRINWASRHYTSASLCEPKVVNGVHFTWTFLLKSNVSLRHFPRSCVTVSQHDTQLTAALIVDS